MAVRYGKFELPQKIKKDEAAKRSNYTRFVAEPFERGFGQTVGNTLRRILLTGIEAPAILSIRIEGVSNEYAAIEGVVEDVTTIVMNFKSALLRKLPTEEAYISREPKVISKVIDVSGAMLDQNGGQYVITLKSLLGDSDFDIVNPDLPLFSVTKPLVKKIDVKIGFGRGYVPSDRTPIVDKMVDEIILDAPFSPVSLVNYYVENTRVGRHTDYDRLILDVTTDGRISPEEALSFATQIGILHLQVFEQLRQNPITFDTQAVEANTDRDELLSKLALKVDDIELTVRSHNCLTRAKVEMLGELVVMSQQEMLKFRNFGKKSLTEIDEKLKGLGLYFGMDLSRYGITRDNIKQIIADYLAQQKEEVSP